MPGPEESRTPYPLLAKQMLYQMSYRPELLLRKSYFKFEISNFKSFFRSKAGKWWALMGSNHRPQRYQHCALAS